MFYHPFPQPSPMTKNIQFLFFLSIFFSSLQRIFCIRFSSVQPSPAPPSFPLSKQDNRSVMICFSLRSLHNSPFFPQCVIHILFLLSPTFFFFFFRRPAVLWALIMVSQKILQLLSCSWILYFLLLHLIHQIS